MKRARLAFALALAEAIATAAGASARAEPASTRLVYIRDHVGASCPDESVMRQAVTARLGYDPFFAWARSAVTFAVRANHDAYVVRVERTDDDGTSLGARELHSKGETCEALVVAAALSLSIALDPDAANRASSDAHLDNPPERPVTTLGHEDAMVPAAITPGLPAPPVPDRLRPSARSPALPTLRAGAFASADWGSAPGAAAGGALHGGIEWRSASIDLEARFAGPAGESTSAGSVQSWLAAGSLVPCARLGPFAACAIGSLGRVSASSSNITSPDTKHALFAAAGARAGVDIPLTDLLSIDLHADALADLSRPTLRIGDATAWNAPAFIASGGAGVVMHFH